MNYDILSIRTESETVQCELNVINSIKKSTVEKHGFRRFENGKVFQTSKVGSASLDQLVAESKKWSGSGLDFHQPFAAAANDKKTDLKKYNFHLTDFKNALSLLHEKYPQFIFKGSCSVDSSRYSLKSSYGLDLLTEGTHLSWFILFQRKGSGSMFDGYMHGLGATSNILRTVQDHFQYLDKYDNLVSLKDDKYPIILADDQDASAPFKKLQDSFLANKYHDGAALYSNKLGQKLFSDKVTLCDQAYSPNRNNLKFFDGEGSVRFDDLAMIENGVFKNLFYDLRYADKYKAQTTANGLRQYNQGVNLAPRHLYFKPGQKTLKSILKDLDRCIYVTIAAGGDSNDLGEFSTPAQVAYVYEKGELIGRAPQITLKTSVDRALNQDLVDISSDALSSNGSGGVLVSEMDVFNN